MPLPEPIPPACARCGVELPEGTPEGYICAACAELSAEENLATLQGEVGGYTPAGAVAIEQKAEVIGDYEILGKLGQGGMGAVYRARQLSLDRVVALKILPSDLEADETYVARFQREAAVAAGLNHPNLVHVYASGFSDGSHFIAMELVEGENLRQRVKRGDIPMAEAVRICLEVARGLQFAWHRAQLIHRDIKPSNIYLAEGGTVKLGDLGLAKSLLSNSTDLTHTGTAIGTPHYISPEQARGEKAIDLRADIYSLGCTLYQLLTGATPYHGTDPAAVVNMHINAPPPAVLKVLPQCPIAVGRLVNKMLRKAKHERHQTYEELITAMEGALEQLEHGVTAAGPSAIVAAWKEIGAAEQHGVVARGTAPTPVVRPAVSTVLPPPRKERTGLWVGFAAAVLALGAGAWWFSRPPAVPGKPSQVAIATAAPAGEQKGASPRRAPSSPELWQDVLADPSKLMLSDGAARTAEGLRIPNSGSAIIRLPAGASRDAAVRMRTTYGGAEPHLLIRRSSDASYYSLRATSMNHALLKRADPGVKQLTTLGLFPIRPPLQPGEEFQLELRAVGSLLTAQVNGQIVGSVTDPTYRNGNLGVNLNSDPGPAFIKSLEVLDLDAPAPATAAPVAGPWHPLLTADEWQASGSKGEIKDGVLHLHAAGIFKPQPTADAAIRARVRVVDNANDPVVKLRGGKPDGSYQASLYRNCTWVALSYRDKSDKSDLSLGTKKLPNSPRLGDSLRLELRAQGTHLTVLVDGVTMIEAEDSRSNDPGTWGFSCHDAWFESVEVQTIDPVRLSAVTPAAATKDAAFTNSLGMKFIPVPIIGGPTNGQRVLFSVWETRVQDYEGFVKETGREWMTTGFAQGPTHPAVRVSWEGATEFCTWLTIRERKAGWLGTGEAYRLPSDHEWSCAAGLGAREDPAALPSAKSGKLPDLFPWGSGWPPTSAVGNYAGEETRRLLETGQYPNVKGIITGYRDGFPETASVGSFPANPFGLYDLGGNAWEWCEDWYDATQKTRTLRGASWDTGERDALLSSYRVWTPPKFRNNNDGFRVVLAPMAP